MINTIIGATVLDELGSGCFLMSWKKIMFCLTIKWKWFGFFVESRDQKPVGKGWSSICGHLQFSIGSGSICFLCCVSSIPLFPYQLYCALHPCKWDECCNLRPLFLLCVNVHHKCVQNTTCMPECYSLWVLANIRGVIVEFSDVSLFSDNGPFPK